MRNFVGCALQGKNPVSAAIIRKLSLETLYTGDREIIDGPDLHPLAVGLIAARIGPDIAVDDECAVPGLLARTGHAADGVVAVFAVIREHRELRMLAAGVRDELLADQKVTLRRPAAIDIGSDLSGFAEGTIEKCALTVPLAHEYAKFPGSCLLICASGLNQGGSFDRSSKYKDKGDKFFDHGFMSKIEMVLNDTGLPRSGVGI